MLTLGFPSRRLAKIVYAMHWRAQLRREASGGGVGGLLPRPPSCDKRGRERGRERERWRDSARLDSRVVLTPPPKKKHQYQHQHFKTNVNIFTHGTWQGARRGASEVATRNDDYLYGSLVVAHNFCMHV